MKAWAEHQAQYVRDLTSRPSLSLAVSNSISIVDATHGEDKQLTDTEETLTQQAGLEYEWAVHRIYVLLLRRSALAVLHSALHSVGEYERGVGGSVATTDQRARLFGALQDVCAACEEIVRMGVGYTLVRPSLLARIHCLQLGCAVLRDGLNSDSQPNDEDILSLCGRLRALIMHDVLSLLSTDAYDDVNGPSTPHSLTHREEAMGDTQLTDCSLSMMVRSLSLPRVNGKSCPVGGQNSLPLNMRVRVSVRIRQLIDTLNSLTSAHTSNLSTSHIHMPPNEWAALACHIMTDTLATLCDAQRDIQGADEEESEVKSPSLSSLTTLDVFVQHVYDMIGMIGSNQPRDASHPIALTRVLDACAQLWDGGTLSLIHQGVRALVNSLCVCVSFSLCLCVSVCVCRSHTH